MILLVLFAAVAVSLETRVVSDHRIDIITDYYPKVVKLQVCNVQDTCHEKHVEDPESRIVSLDGEDSSWDHVELSVIITKADGTSEDPVNVRVNKPPPVQYHYWYIISIVCIVVGMVGLYIYMVKVPATTKTGAYESQRQKNQELARQMGLYDEERNE